MNSLDISNIMSSNEFHGSFSYIWNDGWKVALPFQYIIYSILIGTMIKVLLQYFLWKHTKVRMNFSLWIPSIMLTFLSFFILIGMFSNKPLFVYIILPIIMAISLFVGETFLQKGINEFNWTRRDTV